MKILTVVGARPQFIKAAAVSRPLRQRHQEILVHTGQHYDEAMSDRFFKELDLPKPEIELGIGSGSHGQQTGRMLIGIEAAITQHRPDRVLVYGDTNSTIAGALAAVKMHVPVAHVEAGLRSFNRAMPEEINRVVTDSLSALLLCPSDVAATNLRNEGITSGVHVVGDVMADVLEKFGGNANTAAVLEGFGVREGEYYVATIHRAENTDDESRLRSIIDALSELPLPVVFPAHPRVKAAMAGAGIVPGANVTVSEPVGYASMIAIAKHARAILTDSGGLQKEAYWLGVPCVTLRGETEWVETIAAGWNVLAGAERHRITDAVKNCQTPSARPALYGDGGAAERIIEAITTWN
ncbi:MAG TPA: UDP-N-acetylglucosamine 2-epimerase (non-hydrolyzing) [Vicinamibacterales bacterium]|nr:UDP-N-acetylglucosamine 2-epimerase (non-hydrolyzing) [Vicinamibacterales bacterium]